MSGMGVAWPIVNQSMEIIRRRLLAALKVSGVVPERVESRQNKIENPQGTGATSAFVEEEGGVGRVKEDCRKRQQYISGDILYFILFFLCVYWGRGTIRVAKCTDNRAIIFVHPSGDPASVGRPDKPTIDFRKTTPLIFVTDCRCRAFAMLRRLIMRDDYCHTRHGFCTVCVRVFVGFSKSFESGAHCRFGRAIDTVTVFAARNGIHYSNRMNEIR